MKLWIALYGALSLAAAEPNGLAGLPVEMMAQVWRNAAYLSDGEKQGLDTAARAGAHAAAPLAAGLEPGPELEGRIAALLPVLTQPLTRQMTRLRPEQKRQLADDWGALVHPPGTRTGLPGGGKQWMRMGTALNLNAKQRLALAQVALEMRNEMPALLGSVQAAIDTYGRAVITGNPATSSRLLAASLAELVRTGTRNQEKFLATLDPGQRTRARELMAEMRTAVLAGGGN